MEDDIVRKLRVELERGLSTESQIVYVLVKIRRLLDLDQDLGSDSGYSALRLCCNWAVHVELSHSQAQNIVKLIDTLLLRRCTSPFPPSWSRMTAKSAF